METNGSKTGLKKLAFYFDTDDNGVVKGAEAQETQSVD